MHRLWISSLDTLLRTNFAMLMVKIPKSGILTLTDAQWMPLKVAIWFKIPQSATHDKVFRNSCSVLFTFFVNWRKFKLIITSNYNEPKMMKKLNSALVTQRLVDCLPKFHHLHRSKKNNKNLWTEQCQNLQQAIGKIIWF